MQRVFSYVRMSTPEQLKGDSLRRQTERSAKWAAERNYILDDSLRLQDLGVSAFRGTNAEIGRLRVFLDAVEAGRVPKGSVLLVENLDRLTRDKLRPALQLFLGILSAGVDVATIAPSHWFRSESAEPYDLMFAILELSRGGLESSRKSDLLTQVWANKRTKAKEKPLTRNCPKWLRLVDGAFEPIPERVSVVRRIVAESIAGKGTDLIARTLNRDGVAPLGYGKAWHGSAIQKVIRSRALLGEYQPHTHEGGKRQPVGEPLKGYYPAIVKEAEFYRAQEATRSRYQQRGRIGLKVANLFTGKIRYALDGSNVVLQPSKNSRSKGPHLVSGAAKRGQVGAAPYVSFPYRAFESALLEWTRELETSDLLPQGDDELVRLQEAQATLLDRDLRIATLQERIATDPDFTTLLGPLRRLQEERTVLSHEVEQLKAKVLDSREASLHHTQELLGLLSTTEPEALYDLRLKVRAAIANLVDQILVVFHRGDTSTERWATVVVLFKDDGTQRFLLVQSDRGVCRSWSHVRAEAPDSTYWDEWEITDLVPGRSRRQH